MGINMVQPKRSRAGFTIVEVLVVIVVIGILASIVIVTYESVQSQAKDSAVSSEVSRVTKKLETFATETNQSFPTLTQFQNNFEFLSEDLSRYRYTVFNNNTQFCLTIKDDRTYFYASSENKNPIKGRCTQHQPATITNLVTNPSAEDAGKGYSVIGGASGSTGREVGVSLFGSGSARTLFSSTGAGGTYYGSSSATQVNVTAGQTYTVSFYHKTNKSDPVTLTPRIGWWTSGAVQISLSPGESVVTDNSQWRRAVITATAPANAVRASIYFQSDTSAWANGNRQFIDGLMMVQGTEVYPYADGSFTSPKWSWTGVAHDSTSTGPAF